MLSELSIRNIALIERLRVEFMPGLNVLTGETGAGKSIVVDSVNMALGARASRDLIRTGAESASVQALFVVKNHSRVDTLLSEMGIESDGELLTVSRELNVNGRSLCRINGDVVPLQKFRELTAILVDVHGQHEHQALLRSELHTDYLDAYGDKKHAGLIQGVAEAYQSYAETGLEIQRLSLNALERERRIDMLSHQIKEIEAIKPKQGEDEKLEQKNNLLKNAEKISNAVGKAYQLVYKGENKTLSSQDALKRAADAMHSIGNIDNRFEKLAERLDELFYTVQDVGYELQDLNEGIEYDPDTSQKIDDRLAELKSLKRKYGPELSDVISFLAQSKFELSEIGEGEDKLNSLIDMQAKRRIILDAACEKLTASRKFLAAGFSKSLIAQLTDLGMSKTRFDVRFTEVDPGKTGRDQIEFMISPNPGEPLKPLASIASGGELARIMLAMKAISADTAGVDTMIFDEIDTGVSGRMAQIVGEKMAEVAKKRQVICVTHLPQIAALANTHYLVEKTVNDGRTGSGVRILTESDRVDELARILGGAGSIESGRKYADEMLRSAQALVKE